VSRSSPPGGDPVRQAPVPDLAGRPARESVSLAIDHDVMARLKEAGPGWQDRINAILREACGLASARPRDEGLRPNELTAENDG
jgi:BrnA antitoxin of type II toxin-antitoxin system